METLEPKITKKRRDELLEASEAGGFLAKVYEQLLADRSERDDIALEIAALQNEGLVDAIGTFENLRSYSTGGPDYFMMRHIFEEALPHINAPVPPVMRCVTRLFRDAGQDMAAGTILDSFIEFCTKEESRSREALATIEAGPDEYAYMLTATLIAGSRIDYLRYVEEAIRLSNDPNIDIRRQAVFAIGRLDSPEQASILTHALSALEHSCEIETDDRIFAGILKSAFALLQKYRVYEHRGIDLITCSLEKGSDATLHAASELFGFATENLQPTLLNVILTALLRVNPENKGTLDNIDHGVAHLLTKLEPSGIEFLEKLLLAHPDKLSLAVFDSVIHTIAGNQALTGKLATRWFLKGERVLCDGLDQVTRKMHGTNVTLAVDPSELAPKDSVHIIFIARKAVGYLLMSPLLAASFIVSLMRESADGQLLEELKTLLLDPILLNFPGIAESYLADEAKKGNGPIEAVLGNVIKMLDAYFEMLHDIGPIPELHPSQEQREAHMRHFSRQIAESFKEAEQKSVFLSIFSKSVLLYGRKSIYRVYGQGGQPKRMETPLNKHSTSIDYPRMDIIDPVNLDYMTRIYRAERFRK